MTAALEGAEWSAARPGRTLPPGKTRYPFYRRLGGPQGRSGRAENLVPTWIRSPTVQPVASRYTDWATGPTFILIRQRLMFMFWTMCVCYKLLKHYGLYPFKVRILTLFVFLLPLFTIQSMSPGSHWFTLCAVVEYISLPLVTLVRKISNSPTSVLSSFACLCLWEPSS